MKLNKIKYEDILSYEEFMTKYGKNIRSTKISKNILSHMRAMVADRINYRYYIYKDKIKNILISIAEVKYMDPGRPDVGSIFKLFRNTIYLKRDEDLKHNKNFYNLEKLYNEAYSELKESGYGEYFIGKENDIDYSFDKLLDIEYHLNNFKNYCSKDDSYNEEFMRLLNYELWRFI